MNAQMSDIIKARATQFGDYIFYDCTKIMLSIDHVSLALRLEYLYLNFCILMRQLISANFITIK